MQQQISIIIPAYNEEDYIAYLIDYLKKMMWLALLPRLLSPMEAVLTKRSG